MIFAAVMGVPFVAPPGVPERGAVRPVRKHSWTTMVDPDFLADCARAQLEIASRAGDKVEALVKEI